MSVVFLFFLARVESQAHTGWAAFRETQYAHESLWYVPAKHNASLPVLNYLRRSELLDMGVTVWLAPTELEVVTKKQPRCASSSPESALPDSSVDPKDKVQPKDCGFLDLPLVPIYSDIVFRNATITFKHLQETVKLTLPIAHFRRVNVSANDLRATFNLGPHEGGLLDTATISSVVIP